MPDDFVIVATVLKAIWGLAAAAGLIWLSAHLDQRVNRTFSDSMEQMATNPIALAIYYAGRFIGLCALVGMLAGCAPAAAGTVMPDKYDRHIHRAVDAYWTDYPRFAAAKAQLFAESRLDPAAVSPVGARGVAQFMPATWDEVTRQLRLGQVSPVSDVAIDAYAYYMAKLRQGWRQGREPADRQPLAQASYNAGVGNIIKAQRVCGGARLWAGIAPCLSEVTGAAHSRETLTYVDRIARFTALVEAGL